MKAYLETAGGISAPMLIGACLAAGLHRQAWLDKMESFDLTVLGTWTLKEKRVRRAGAEAVRIQFAIKQKSDEVYWDADQLKALSETWDLPSNLREWWLDALRLSRVGFPHTFTCGEALEFCLDTLGFSWARWLMGLEWIGVQHLPLTWETGRIHPRYNAYMHKRWLCRSIDLPREIVGDNWGITTYPALLLLAVHCAFSLDSPGFLFSSGIGASIESRRNFVILRLEQSSSTR